jgi:hypothetical protein
MGILQAVHMCESAQPGFLHGIFGVGVIAQNGARNTKQALVVAAHDALKGGGFAAFEGVNQRCVFGHGGRRFR